MELYKWDGTAYVKVAETTTDSYGRYIFSQNANSNGLNAEDWSFTGDNAVLPKTQYQVRVLDWASNTALVAYGAGLGYSGIVMSPADTNGNDGDIRDNDGLDDAGNAVVTLTTNNNGENNHTYDFGFGGVGGCEAPNVIPTANTICNGETLNVMAAVSGGISPYTYSWSGPNNFTSNLQNPSIANADSSLNAGIYYLTVTDNVGCQDTTHIHAHINKITISTVITDAACGTSDGEIDLSVDVGLAEFTYDWDNDGTGDNDDTEDLTGLSAGTYAVTVTDTDGCTTSTAASIGSSGSVTLSATHINESCTAGNGSIDLSITGDYTTIDWSNDGTGDNDDTEDLTGLSAGTYSVTVNNASNCPAILSITLTNTEGPSVSATQTNTTCGNSNGSIDLVANGGVAPYSFDWDNDGTGDNDDTEDLNNLSAGVYNVTVSDATGCTTNVAVTLTDTGGPSLSTNTVDETCNTSNGSIDLTVTGGTAPFIYSWNNGLISEDISGLGLGTFIVTVTDANGCTATTSASISNIDGPTISLTQNNATYCNASDGSINLTVSGGAVPYTYDWNNDGYEVSDNDTEDLNNLLPGSYAVIVTDANGCTATDGTTILNINEPILTTTITEPTTCSETGSIDLTITGGVAPFTYDWSNDGLGDNDDTEDVSDLEGGVYTVIVTGADGCSVQANASVQLIREPIVTETLAQPTCGNADGAISLAISDPDGGAPYTFDWDIDGIGDNDDNQDQSTLATGNYSVTVTNGIGCATIATYSLSPSTLSPSLTLFQTNPNCEGTDGAIDIIVSGGSAPFTFDWDIDGTGDNDDTKDLNNLSEGVYNVTVTDSGGCEAVGSVELISSEFPILNTLIADENCSSADGNIDLSVTGVAPFAYDWSDDSWDGVEDPNGLSAGTYSVTVTDGNGCSANSADLTVAMNDAPTLTIVSAVCDANSTTYTIDFTSSGIVSSDVGTVSGNQVIDIPIGVDANLTAELNGCTTMEIVTAPDCNPACPTQRCLRITIIRTN